MMIELPPTWGQDSLSAFTDTATRNNIAFFESRQREYRRLAEIDKAFADLSETRPTGFGAFFLIRCHAAFRGAVRMATSGQVAETYVVIRSALEWALYASDLHDEPDASERWLRRHDGEASDGSETPESEASRKKVRREFTPGRLFESLAKRSAGVQSRASDLYQHSIDSGAHPNERALTSSMRVESTGTFELAQIVAADSLAMELAVKQTARVGVCALDIFELIWRDRFRITGLDRTMDSLRRGL